LPVIRRNHQPVRFCRNGSRMPVPPIEVGVSIPAAFPV
jgi:hypothetical protein